MALRYSVLCLLALFMIVLLTLKNYDTWTAPLSIPPEKVVSKKSSVKPESPLAPGDQKDGKAAPSIASYILIAEKNPFHPDRKEFPILTEIAKPEVKKPVVRPQVTLYGVTLVGDYRSASISYPGRPLQKGEREIVTVKIGDRVGEYKLAKILEDRIGLETPEDSFEVLLYDSRTPKRRVAVKTENKPASVTSTIPTPPAPPEAAKPAPPRAGETPGAPVRGAIASAPVPTPVTPAIGPGPVPTPTTPRTRRWYGPRPSGGE
ncbi:MAG TPA: hypothetical protein VLK23_05470 [Thermodesulfobacteriota bacterium]|nr:hypothetical protein [Thermodesulfobacteriota bacterium]